MSRAALVLVWSTGCSSIFGLDELGPLADAGPTIDAGDAGDDPVIDALSCLSRHDEDDDGLVDDCDRCPATPDTLADVDDDGVGDACDPNPTTPGDKILLFDPFTNGTGYTFSGTVAAFADEVLLSGVTTLTMTGTFAPTRVEVGLGYTSARTPDVISMFAGHDGIHIDQCILDHGDGACGLPGNCLGASVDNFNPTVTPWPSIAATDRVRLDVDAGTFRCTASAGASAASVASTMATVAAGGVGVISHVTNGDEARITFVIVYGH